ncbi:MAG: DapH/DapD/GlmU-related protein [Rhodoferax sp.]|nr:DapH/DapD/GlmU-related protein [Rhodoferax sp.]
MLRNLLNKFATRVKGSDYQLDPKLPLLSLVGLASRRLTWLIRGRLAFPLRRSAIYLGDGSVLRNRAQMSFEPGVTIGRGCVVDALSANGLRIGRNVNIGPYTTIQASGVLSRLGTGCSIGANSGIGGYSFIGCGGGVAIGSNVIMGQYVSFHSENHVIDRTDVPIRVQGVVRKGIVIEDDCWVGAKATFLDGCHVGKGCVVAAGAVVRGNIPPYSIIGGVPAKVIRSRLAVDSSA